MERIFVFIKHHFRFLWNQLEWSNGVLFNFFYKSEMEINITQVLGEFASAPFKYRRLVPSDMKWLFSMVKSQPESDLKYFHPHDFDMKSLKKQSGKKAFLMMGVFDKEMIIGYFFLRFFINKKCFVGRLIDIDHRGRDIGKVMNSIMYEIAWRMNFRCLSTISRKNIAIMRAHSKNPAMVVLKELRNDYLLVEFIRDAQSAEQRAQRVRI